MNVNQGTVGSDPVILATAGYDHTVRFWQAHSGICTRTVQHQDSVSLPQTTNNYTYKSCEDAVKFGNGECCKQIVDSDF